MIFFFKKVTFLVILIEQTYEYVSKVTFFMLLCFFFVARLNFKEVLLDCDTDLFKKVHGVQIYETIQSDPTLNNVFNKTMATMCTLEMNKILEIYSKFKDISLLVDVGGGFGQNLNMIISKYPSIKGINFDLPLVIQNAPDYPGMYVYVYLLEYHCLFSTKLRSMFSRVI